jgi:glycerate 2-kinase
MNQDNINILIAPDSFKDCLSSYDVAKYIEDGIYESALKAKTKPFPLADGGEGTANCIHFHKGGRWIDLPVHDPLLRPINKQYLFLEKEQTAVIELATASGLELLSLDERNALKTSTVGTGEFLRDALDNGLKKLILTIGGSATVDGGVGIAAALGFKFFDNNGKEFTPHGGGNLLEISRIYSSNIHPHFQQTEVIIACDVQNILNGPEGAARVYGPQKGADANAVDILERGLRHLSELIFRTTGFNADDHPGTGAAGGAALFFLAFGNGKLRKGFDIVAELTGLETEVSACDIVITGEGRIDQQTTYGKLVSSVAGMVKKHNKGLIGVAGRVDGNKELVRAELGMNALFSIREMATSDEDSLQNASWYLKTIGKTIGTEISEIGRSR